MTGITTRRPAGLRELSALLLLTAGGLMLAGLVVPLAGAAVALVLGVELVVWAVVTRDDVPLIVGGVVAGVGVGPVLADGPLAGADPQVIGAAFLLGLAGGFAFIAVLSLLVWRRRCTWAWLAAVAAIAIGVGILDGGQGVADMLAWVLPSVLLLSGAVQAVRQRRR